MKWYMQISMWGSGQLKSVWVLESQLAVTESAPQRQRPRAVLRLSTARLRNRRSAKWGLEDNTAWYGQEKKLWVDIHSSRYTISCRIEHDTIELYTESIIHLFMNYFRSSFYSLFIRWSLVRQLNMLLIQPDYFAFIPYEKNNTKLTTICIRTIFYSQQVNFCFKRKRPFESIIKCYKERPRLKRWKILDRKIGYNKGVFHGYFNVFNLQENFSFFFNSVTSLEGSFNFFLFFFFS